MEVIDNILFEIFGFLFFMVFVYKFIGALVDDKNDRLLNERNRLEKRQKYLKGEIYKYHYKNN